jgi:CarD family transcriptional regulator
MVNSESKNKLRIDKDEAIFCPSHGIGVIQSIEKTQYLGTDLELCVIRFQREKMNLMIPLAKIKEVGIRPLSSKSMVLKIIKNILTKAPKIGKGIWTKRIVECETKLYSGSIILIAEVVRDLFPGTKDPNRSYSERVLFEKAMNRMIEEFAFVLAITPEEVNAMVMDALLIGSPEVSSNIVDHLQASDAEGDFEDTEIDNSVESEDQKIA